MIRLYHSSKTETLSSLAEECFGSALYRLITRAVRGGPYNPAHSASRHLMFRRVDMQVIRQVFFHEVLYLLPSSVRSELGERQRHKQSVHSPLRVFP